MPGSTGPVPQRAVPEPISLSIVCKQTLAVRACAELGWQELMLWLLSGEQNWDGTLI